MREQEPDFWIVVQPGGLLERPERVVRPPRIDPAASETFEERRIVGCLGQPLPEQERRLVRPALAERVPAPVLEAADHVLAPRRARWITGSRQAELLARPCELSGGVEPDSFLAECLRVARAKRCEHDCAVVSAALVAASFAPAKRQRGGAEQQRGEDDQADVSDGGHARAQRAGSIRNRGCPNSTGCAFSTKILTTRPATLDSISFISFIASMMHRIWPSLTTSPSLTYGSAVGEDAR